MSDDTHDHTIDLAEPYYDYEDPVSQRAMAFCHVAKLANTIKDEAVKEMCLTMLRKLDASVRTPSTVDLCSIEEDRCSEKRFKTQQMEVCDRLHGINSVSCIDTHWSPKELFQTNVYLFISSFLKSVFIKSSVTGPKLSPAFS